MTFSQAKQRFHRTEVGPPSMAAFDHAHGAEGPTTQLQKKGLRHRGKELSRWGVISGLGIWPLGFGMVFQKHLEHH